MIIVHKADTQLTFSGLNIATKQSEDEVKTTISTDNDNQEAVSASQIINIDSKTTKILQLTENCETVLLEMHQNSSGSHVVNEYVPMTFKIGQVGMASKV